MGCRLVRGKIRFPGTPGLIARVGATSTELLSRERMSGTHVMLCADVNRDTEDTVAIQVSGNLESGNVYRQDGYVLELHQWLEGDPESLNGRHWTIGSVPVQ